MLVSPHGSVGLKPLLLPPSAAEEARRRASSFEHKIEMTSRELSDLLMLGMGAYTPLDGFMGLQGLARCLRGNENRYRLVLAHSDHAVC